MSEDQLLKVAIAAAGTIQSGRYVTVAVYALAVYEWLITFDDEVDLIHLARWNAVKFAFLACRYYPIICWALYLWAFVQDHNLETCRHIVKLLYAFLIPFQLCAQGVMVVRAWAFTGRTRAAFFVLVIAYAILSALELWVFATGVSPVDPSPITNIIGQTGCFRSRGEGFMQTPDKVAVILVSACFVDFLCTSVIAFHCFRLRSLQGPLGKTFVIQSLGAFVIMTAVHITSATISFRNKTFAGGIVAPIPLILSNIVACRLILSIRRRVSPTETTESRELSQLVRNALDLSSTVPSKSDQWAL
ncbi:hypothetical protein BDZ94DRAFT_172345 [Collybia nuda]|uniref:DUF6533 domain-containing protein n=1 Tax=Collybia nuda TaxID=64659 RepID=A0A9P5YD76_9AGAR|nr:hypothetical protein BDZ94DRAFT_172345 [Collybia nuda]